MRRILLMGMSGVGKSTIAEALRTRGYAAVDTDRDAYRIAPDGEWLWDEAAIDRHLSRTEVELLFIIGSASNQSQFYPRFDVLILLSAPVEVMTARIRARTNNPFGKSEEELARILRDTKEIEPLMRGVVHAEVRTDRPLDDVVDEILALALS